jgi:PAS domain-containing protein
VINQYEVMVVHDATQDERFHDNPSVIGEAHLRFYAGVALRSPLGLALGALCVIDDKPHPEFSEEDGKRLQELAKMASDRLELRRIEFSTERTRPSFEKYAGGSTTPIVWFDDTCAILEWNDVAKSLFGYQSSGKNAVQFDMLLREADRTAFRQLIKQAAGEGSLDQIEIPTEIKC